MTKFIYKSRLAYGTQREVRLWRAIHIDNKVASAPCVNIQKNAYNGLANGTHTLWAVSRSDCRLVIKKINELKIMTNL